jgi:restriction endonuclease
MLTHTDVHLLIGMLSLITNPEDVEVELGSRVLDQASGTERDVDITVTTRNVDGSVVAYAGIEVKDETRRLGTPTVEQLIAKLNDMPSITRKAIVSSSGYAAPAKAKAAYHGIELLTLREWRRGERVYSFLNPEFSAAVEFHLSGWVQPPEVRVETDREEAGKLPSTALVLDRQGNPLTLGQVIDQLSARVLTAMNDAGTFDDMAHGAQRTVRRRLVLENPLRSVLGTGSIRILGFEIVGTVIRINRREAPAMKLLVNEATGDPHAACLVGLTPTNDLWGAVFTGADLNPHMVKISVADRNLAAINRLKLPRKSR